MNSSQSLSDKIWQSMSLIASWTKELANRLSPKQIAILIIAFLVSASCFLGWYVVTSPVTIDDVPAPIFVKLREQNQLVTATYTTQEIVEASKSSLLGETKLLYLAMGNITAGVDFSKIEVKNSRWGFFSKAAQVILPAPQVFDVQIDVARSRIYDIRKQTWVSPGKSAELLEQAQQLAKAKIRKKACQADLLQYASKRSQALVTQLLHQAGYNHLSVQSQLDSATCYTADLSSPKKGHISAVLPPVKVSTVL